MFPGVLLLSFSLWVQFLSRPPPGTKLLCTGEWEETGKMLPMFFYAVILRFEVCRIFSASLLYSIAFLSYFPWFPAPSAPPLPSRALAKVASPRGTERVSAPLPEASRARARLLLAAGKGTAGKPRTPQVTLPGASQPVFA